MTETGSSKMDGSRSTRGRRRWLLAIAIALLVPLRPALRAQTGWQLDPTFGNAGTLTLDFAAARDAA